MWRRQKKFIRNILVEFIRRRLGGLSQRSSFADRRSEQSFTSPLEDDIQTWPYQEEEAKVTYLKGKFLYNFGSPDTFTLAWRKVKENNRKMEHHDTRDRKTKLQRDEFHRTEGGEKVTYKILVN